MNQTTRVIRFHKTGGPEVLRIEEVRAALNEFVRHKNLLGLDVAQYNPDKDADGAGAKKVIDLLVDKVGRQLKKHLEKFKAKKVRSLSAGEVLSASEES